MSHQQLVQVTCSATQSSEIPRIELMAAGIGGVGDLLKNINLCTCDKRTKKDRIL